MKIIMRKTAQGSVDGIRVASYEQGVEYDLGATAGEIDLAAAFVGSGMAEEVAAKIAPQPQAPVAEVEAPAPVPAPKPAKQPKPRK